uniref:Uncharacterized protein n=1 Tax=Anguilla anguilla TaxID=7936 RepID=A0A0E9XKJ9_ANGAN
MQTWLCWKWTHLWGGQ